MMSEVSKLEKQLEPEKKDLVKKLMKIIAQNKGKVGFVKPIILYNALEGGQIKLLEENDEIIGFLYFNHKKKSKNSYISKLAVGKDFFNQGIESRLLNNFIQECKQLGRDTIEYKTQVQDNYTNKIMENNGFEFIGQEKGKILLNKWLYRI